MVCAVRSAAALGLRPLHAGVDEGLDHQEEIRRTGPRQRGDASNVALGNAQHPADGVEQGRDALELGRRDEPALGQGRDPRADGAAAFGMARTTGVPAGIYSK